MLMWSSFQNGIGAQQFADTLRVLLKTIPPCLCDVTKGGVAQVGVGFALPPSSAQTRALRIYTSYDWNVILLVTSLVTSLVAILRLAR